MPANPVTINLLGRDDLGHSPSGRIVSWAVTYGRYIIIATEVVVLLAFISRFSLDRKLTDLNEEISQKQIILTSNIQLEADIRILQDRLAQIKSLINDQNQPYEFLMFFQRALPPDVYLTVLTLSKNNITGEGVAATTEGFAQFLVNLNANKKISNVDIGEVKKKPLSGIAFTFKAIVPAISGNQQKMGIQK